MARLIKLYPVRVSDSENFAQKWRLRTQVLGSILYWASEANVIRIEVDSTSTEPFSYFTEDGRTVTTEMGPTPQENVSIVPLMIRDTIDGHPAIRPFRRLIRFLTNSPAEANFEVPDSNFYSGSRWSCIMQGDNATFLKQLDLPLDPNAT